MRSITLTLLAASSLSLAACESPAEQAAKSQAEIARDQAEATADAMANHADELEAHAQTLTHPANLAVSAEARVLDEQADKTEKVVDELRERIQAGARP